MGIDPKNQKYRNKPKRSKRVSERSLHHPSRRRGGGGYRTDYPAPILRDDDLVFGFGNSNAGIIAGKNRVDQLDSGFGGLGKDHCGELYLVAGIGRGEKETHPSAKLGGMEVATHINPKTDAAFIKISEMANIDSDLGYGKGAWWDGKWKPLAAGSMGQPARHSAIGMSADGIRICGDEGIKLVTKRKRYNSKGEVNSATFGVDLIAGNDGSKLQPMVKGDNLLVALKYLQQEISQLNGIVHKIMQAQMQYNIILMNHFHHSPFFGIPTTLSVGCFKGGMKRIVEHVSETLDLIFNKINQQLDDFEFLFPFGKGYICSRYHHLN